MENTLNRSMSLNDNAKILLDHAERELLISGLLDSLDNILRKENSELQSTDTEFVDTSTREKLQLLSTINRLSLEVEEFVCPTYLQKKIESAVKLLSQNEHLLKLRIQAIEEVTHSISDAIINAESDGTYNRAQLSGRTR